MTFQEAVEAMKRGCSVGNDRFTRLYLADFGRTYRDELGDVSITEKDTYTKKRKVRGLDARDKKSEWRITVGPPDAFGIPGEDFLAAENDARAGGRA